MAVKEIAFKVPDNLGCRLYCAIGSELSRELREDASFGDERLAREVVAETEQLLTEDGCAFIETGRCALAGYLMHTAMAYRLLYEGSGE